MLPSLFVHVKVKDYVPDGFADFADALMNPIAYQSEIDKREDQLKALEDDAEIDEVSDSGCSLNDYEIRICARVLMTSQGFAVSRYNILKFSHLKSFEHFFLNLVTFEGQIY